MSTVLELIIEGVLEDVRAREIPLKEIYARLDHAPELRGAHARLSAASKRNMHLIAEVKRSSPSKGELATIGDPAALAAQYQEGGASVVSVLTEQRRFKGSIRDFEIVRPAIDLPVLRKDFIVTEFQVVESRLLGADLLLLIVAGLSKSQLTDFYQLATELGMDLLVETHDEDEVEAALDLGARIIGVNSRNLKTLEVDTKAFDRLIPMIPSDRIKVAESGIQFSREVEHLRTLGANAILVGERLVKSGRPADAINQLLGGEGAGTV